MSREKADQKEDLRDREHTLKERTLSYDVVVAGGGMSGVCAALSAARDGAKTALVHDRPVLGGNASSEVRMHICGALGVEHNRPNRRETGIIEEILLENVHRNPQHSFSIFDTILWEKTRYQEGLDLFLNTHMHSAELKGGPSGGAGRETLSAVVADQLTTESRFRFAGDLFIDATGDGLLAVLAGCSSMRGREGKEAFGESLAPDKEDTLVMGNTVLFEARDLGRPVPFEKPAWAYSFTQEDFRDRNFDELTSGYWWVELGGGEKDVIRDGELLRDELIKTVYGVWDFIKNSGTYNADTLALDWIGFLPGKRESRRVVGEYVLREQDLLGPAVFKDAVAYGGWPIDLHVPEGIKSKEAPNRFVHIEKVYPIPLRSLIAKDAENLLLAGRAISVSHVAFGSTRVMATCSVVGQAVGTAAAHCIRRELGLRELMGREGEIGLLQQQLLKGDAYIPGVRLDEDVHYSASPTTKEGKGPMGYIDNVTASSWIEGGEPELVVNGGLREDEEGKNSWISEDRGDLGDREEKEWISITFKQPVRAAEMDVRFDSNLSRENMLSISDWVLVEHYQGTPPELVKDYILRFRRKGEEVFSLDERGNYLRHRRYSLKDSPPFDECLLTVEATHGVSQVRVFEIRFYGP